MAKTLKDLEDIIRERTLEIFNRELEHPSEKWMKTLQLYFIDDIADTDDEDWEYDIVKGLTTFFVNSFRKEITGLFRNSDILKIYDCSPEDIISLKEEFLIKEFPEPIENFKEQIRKDIFVKYFAEYLEERDYNSLLSDIIEFSEMPSATVELYSTVKGLIKKNFDTLYNLVGVPVPEVEISEEDYDEGFDESLIVKHRRRLRY